VACLQVTKQGGDHVEGDPGKGKRVSNWPPLMEVVRNHTRVEYWGKPGKPERETSGGERPTRVGRKSGSSSCGKRWVSQARDQGEGEGGGEDSHISRHRSWGGVSTQGTKRCFPATCFERVSIVKYE